GPTTKAYGLPRVGGARRLTGTTTKGFGMAADNEQQVDLIIHAAWILPMAADADTLANSPRTAALQNCSVVVEHGKIIAIQPTAQTKAQYRGKEEVTLNQHVLMPGLINAHGHAAMSLLRGYADDLPLKRWLEEHIWPAEAHWVDAKFVEDGTELAVAEMLKGGTTCFSDMYFYPEAAAEVARVSGIRAQITFPILDFPTPWAQTPDEAITKGIDLHDRYRAIERITVGFGPHAPYTVSDDVFARIAVLSAELQAPVHIHLHETQAEVDDAIAANGERPIDRLQQLGILTPRTQCVHMTAVNESDIAITAQHGASVIHCPESNLKLASGLCPTQALIDAGITVALGTDGAASNNDLDMFGELQTAALIGKVTANNAEAICAYTALTMATLNGAKALGIDEITGSLEVGKAADMIAISLDDLACLPAFNLASLLVYTNQSRNVTDVWVDGRRLLRDKLLTTLNEAEIKRNALGWQQTLAEKTA
ncbi:MAG TPA: TRZ/ATZ family hydrolase, partial [Marinagarivorans sp.]